MQEEVQLIRSQIESSASSSTESYLEKISFLQKCILKMEKLYQKAERDNMKQIVKLKRELEVRDKSNQVSLLIIRNIRPSKLTYVWNYKKNIFPASNKITFSWSAFDNCTTITYICISANFSAMSFGNFLLGRLFPMNVTCTTK